MQRLFIFLIFFAVLLGLQFSYFAETLYGGSNTKVKQAFYIIQGIVLLVGVLGIDVLFRTLKKQYNILIAAIAWLILFAVPAGFIYKYGDAEDINVFSVNLGFAIVFPLFYTYEEKITNWISRI